MTREIKFRVWDSKEKVMYEGSVTDLAMTLKGRISLLISTSETLEWEGTDYSKHLIPLQYTGLKDRKGVEIYEGDIVEINGNQFYISFEIGSFILVRCSEDICMYENFKSCWNDDVYPLSQYYWESNFEDGTLEDCTIIGQIPFDKFI